MKIAEHIKLPILQIKKGSQVMVIDNPDSNWMGIGEFEEFEDTVGNVYTVETIDYKSHEEVSVYLSNDFWYPLSTLVGLN